MFLRQSYSFDLFVVTLYSFVGWAIAGDVTFTRCDTNVVEYTLPRINIIDNNGPDLCNMTGCTVVADHSYTITIDACVNLPSAVPITSLPFDIDGVLTFADGGLPLLLWDLQLDNGNLCTKFDPNGAINSCPIPLVTASPTTPKCFTLILNIPAPFVRRALSCLPLPNISRPGLVTARVWKNSQGTNAQAIVCVNVAVTYQLL